jgi:hemoglobin
MRCDDNQPKAAEPIATEAQIALLVGRFYAQGLQDADLKRVFDAVISDWESHHRDVIDFWSRVLLGTTRYRGTPYAARHHLPLTREHFKRWLTCFRQAADQTLPADAARRAIARAEHMSEAFMAGMFTFVGPPRLRRARRA